MSASGLCELCERPDVEHTCGHCGRLVCDRHYDDDADACVDCASAIPDDRIPSDLPDGVDTYQF